MYARAMFAVRYTYEPEYYNSDHYICDQSITQTHNGQPI